MLTPQKRLFAQEYQIDMNGAAAARRAGYAAEGAKHRAYILLHDPEVKGLIEEGMRQRFERIHIDADFVLQGLARIARANATDLMRIDPGTGLAAIDLRGATPEALETISSIETEEYAERTGPGRDDVETVRRTRLKLHDKTAAYIALGRHLKLFTDRTEVRAEIEIGVTDARDKLAARLNQLPAPSR